ncbi:MAG: ATP-dependent helicase HrpA, partial [Pseudomonadota bacterium]|nr:ATP-dependent helicase HrpA [Pseudomonadota bacterium]
QTCIKLMTDGILLSEIHHDPLLYQYDTLIIDEAHERSLNIDFLLGYLWQLLPRRPDLKIIITSATIDPNSFSRHFGNAPVIEVSGRSYPVEVYYQPLHGDDEETQQISLPQGVVAAVNELMQFDDGDVLVFLSGERDIRECADELQKMKWRNTEILPLLSRLSNSEQNKIFHPAGKRRVVLATNIAETSLTVPGIKYVVDSGLARVSRYAWRSRMQRLPIEKISQAAANQRKGRCGRTSPGVCLRLYSEEDFGLRPAFTEPEIQRTNLASVILQMEHLQLGHVEDFPFIEAPDSRLVSDGYKLLFELNAIDDKHRITSIGRKLARLPMDPKLGRMLIESEKESALNEVLIITSALAIQDVRERPMDKQQAADEAHKKFADNRSDFISLLNIWHAWHKQQQKLSAGKLRQWCKENFISWLRIREWRDTHQQIAGMLDELKLRFNQQPADYNAIHRSLLTGLLGNIGMKGEEREYIGARNRKFLLFPGSGLFNAQPKWMMAGEIVETSKVYSRLNAKIDPLWIEQKAKHLLKRSYSSPHWEKRSAQVAALENTTLYGVLISAQRKVNYGPIDPDVSRKLFIRSALVEGEYESGADFFRHNRNLITELESLEAKSRRQDIVVDDEVLFEFYDEKIPAGIYSGAQFEQWIKSLDADTRKALHWQRENVMQHDAAQVTTEQYPDHLHSNGIDYPLQYHFDPAQHCDGITLITPIAALNALNAQRCEWLVPGMLHEKITAMIRSLPKSLRVHFVPAPQFATACMQAVQISDTSLATAMANHLKKISGVDIPFDAWRLELLESHLLMNFRVLDNNGKILAEGRDLQAIKDKIGNTTVTVPVKTDTHSIERDDVTP